MKTILFIVIIAFATFSNAQAQSGSLPQTTVVSDTAKLGQYAGLYKMADGSPLESMKIYMEAGGLLVDAGTYGISKLKETGKDTFEESQNQGVFTFTRIDGAVTGFKLAVMGNDLVGTKAPATK